MQQLNRTITNSKNKLPIKIIQFGEGNFLRAFVNFAIQKLNDEQQFNAGVAVIQPLENGLIDLLNKQEGLYTLFLKGYEKGIEIEEKKLITNIIKSINPYQSFDEYLQLAEEETLTFVISNTTEAGIAFVATDTPEMRPPSSFPAKLTILLYKRFQHFNGASDKGLTIIPCELINYNADTLKEIILQYVDLWQLAPEFKSWILKHNSFHNTLVDRIVPGYPKDTIESYNKQLPYHDNLIVSAETFFLWVIEGDEILAKKLPFDKTDLDVKIVADMQPFRTRKVRILNGAHTALVPLSILYGNTTVKESIDNSFTGSFIRKAVFEEIVETFTMDSTELNDFANAVFDRFRNPFVKHLLSSIALNSISKFNVRVLPSLLEYQQKRHQLPLHLTFSFACLIRFYKGDWKGEELPLQDDAKIITYFADLWKNKTLKTITTTVLGNLEFWEKDLNQIPKLTDAIIIALEAIEQDGIEIGFKNYCKIVNL